MTYTYEDNVYGFLLTEIELFKFGINPVDSKSRDYSDLRTIKWCYFVPEHSLLSDDRALVSDRLGNDYDMRKLEDVDKHIRMMLASFYSDYESIRLDEIFKNSGTRFTKNERRKLIKGATEDLLRKLNYRCMVKRGDVWTDEDYDKVKQDVDDRIFEIDVSNMSDEEIDALRASIRGKTGDRIIKMVSSDGKVF